MNLRPLDPQSSALARLRYAPIFINDMVPESVKTESVPESILIRGDYMDFSVHYFDALDSFRHQLLTSDFGRAIVTLSFA